MSVTAYNSLTRTHPLPGSMVPAVEVRLRIAEPAHPAPTSWRAQLERWLACVAPAEVPVLILGETGSGKEVVARVIHERSRRSSKPFIKINCAALPSELI